MTKREELGRILHNQTGGKQIWEVLMPEVKEVWMDRADELVSCLSEPDEAMGDAREVIRAALGAVK